eukprot:gnl/TRDRNA2_/TRDRNA2_156750_c2_seq1.p1 gnl/TRDRNA2_/TRDRNA2_156750_c2~~gnl/TRDRNA2_/TRDRNA2_156750_c2_seq1.p1  ORF type:complete len:158 (-),score=27.07 gnl/TRDRNA2_/TRDRNA2_156750_c2_seq1:153-626(-)
MYRSFAFQAMIANQTFKSLDPDGSGFIDFNELVDHFDDILLPHLHARFPNQSEEFYKEHMGQFVGLLASRFDVKGTKEKRIGISQKAFIEFCTQSEAMLWDDIMDKVADPDIDLLPGAKLLGSRWAGPSSRVQPICLPPEAADVKAEGVHSSKGKYP